MFREAALTRKPRPKLRGGNLVDSNSPWTETRIDSIANSQVVLSHPSQAVEGLPRRLLVSALPLGGFASMEATVICVDNSEWTRNSDYAPTRFQAQADCVNLLAGAKTQANAENTVGVLTMAGKSPRVLVTPTPDLGKILNAMQDLDIEGASDLPSSVQIAQLALKHRQNKNQRQRAVIFVGSPIKEDKVSRDHASFLLLKGQEGMPS